MFSSSSFLPPHLHPFVRHTACRILFKTQGIEVSVIVCVFFFLLANSSFLLPFSLSANSYLFSNFNHRKGLSNNFSVTEALHPPNFLLYVFFFFFLKKRKWKLNWKKRRKKERIVSCDKVLGGRAIKITANDYKLKSLCMSKVVGAKH